jgi:N-acetylglucosaminyl-diphospho-decaprenol L-rhamnosyltransferase
MNHRVGKGSIANPSESGGDEAARIDDQAVTVVIVTYNSAAVLDGLLSSLLVGLDGIDAQVIVVDNRSSDQSVSIAAAHPVRPTLLLMDRNAGYAGAINAAIATVPPHHNILVLNPDIRVASGAVAALLDRMSDPTVGVAVPRTLSSDGSLSYSLRRMPSVRSAWAEAILGGSLADHLGFGEKIADEAHYQEARTVDWATGAALMISAKARRSVGEWDESYFLYSEEVDYLMRVRSCGLSVTYVPPAQVIHFGGDYRVNPLLSALLTVNRIRFFKRHHGAYSSALFTLGVLFGKAIRGISSGTHRAAFLAGLRSRHFLRTCPYTRNHLPTINAVSSGSP